LSEHPDRVKQVRSIDGIELISHVPDSVYPVPLLFVHGAFTAAWCWDEYFLPYFAQRGFAAHALSLRGHGGSDGRAMLAAASIDDYESDVLRIVRDLGGRVVLIGHSLGGMVVQRCLHRVQATAAVLMASVPPDGLLGSSMLLAARDPALFSEINLIHCAAPGFATLQGLRRAVFSQRLPDAEAVRHLVRMQPESQRAIMDLSWPQYFFVRTSHGVPVQVLGGGGDAFFPPYMVESTARSHGVPADILPAMAHAMMLDPDWQLAADHIIDWLSKIKH
jgi:pimeloyl-ACP methyl ester carboxylesterase